jgi:hypothetical protein
MAPPTLVEPKPTQHVLVPNRVSKRRPNLRQSKMPRHSSGVTRRSDPSPKRVILGLLIINNDGDNERYECPLPACTGKTFGRAAELKRHHVSCHDGFGNKKAQYWCPVSGCERSKTGDQGSFPRKDKMIDHLERMHKDEVSGE